MLFTERIPESRPMGIVNIARGKSVWAKLDENILKLSSLTYTPQRYVSYTAVCR